MKTILLLLMIIFEIAANAEFKTGVSAYYGRGVFYNDQEEIRPGETVFTRYQNNFVAGVYLNYRFNKWIGLQMDFMYDQLNTFDGYYIIAAAEGTWVPLPAGETETVFWWKDELWTKFEYLSFPFQIEFMTDRFDFKIGAQYSYLVAGQSHHHNWSYNNWLYNQDGNTYSEYKKIAKFDFERRHNIAFTTSFGIRVIDNLHLEFRFTNGLINLNPDYYQCRAWTRQYLLGLTYQLAPSRKKEVQKHRKTRNDYEGIGL